MDETLSAAAGGARMRRVALEEHFVLDDALHVDRWRTLVPGVPDGILDKILPHLTDLGDRRLESMAAAGIDLAVLSNVGTVQGVVDATLAMRLAREANDRLADAVQRHPDHFAGFATVPLQRPEAGADELQRAVEQLGMKGTLLIGHTGGLYLDDRRFDPIWERAQALDVPVYLHAADPMVLPPTYAGQPELIGATWSWTAETAAHTLRIIFGGVFQRFPKVRLLLGHLGETLPFLIDRIDARARAFSEDEQASKPSDFIHGNLAVTTAGMPFDDPLACVLQALGEDAVMFSVDHPFESMAEASTWLDDAPISHDLREKISWRNASRILKL